MGPVGVPLLLLLLGSSSLVPTTAGTAPVGQIAGCLPDVCEAVTVAAGRLPRPLPDLASFARAQTISDALGIAVPGTPAPGTVDPPQPAAGRTEGRATGPLRGLPPEVGRAIDILLDGARRAEALRAAALAEPDGTPLQLLQVPYLGTVSRGPIRPHPRVGELAERIDPDALKAAGAVLTAAADRAIAVVDGGTHAAGPCDGEPTAPTEVSEGIVVDTEGVRTLYDQPYTLSLDLGGCDVYHNEAGGADGTSEEPGLGIAIDLGGHDDRYTQPKDSYALGGANNGLGLLVDDGGNDEYRASSWASMGAGIVSAVGILADLGGDDTYEYVGSGGGFGAHGNGTLGMGVLLDLGGDDTYHYEFDPGDSSFGTRLLAAQGAGTAGGIGVLADGGGDDTYTSIAYGNTVRIEAQGAADFAALGILIDSSGDDAYTSEAHVSKPDGHSSGAATGQGEGILDGVGLLMDGGGDDRYTLHADASGSLSASASATGQGFGTAVITYAAAGFLLDLGGDDTYASTALAASGDPETEFATSLTQGAGYLIASGLLADLSGTDTYTQSTQGADTFTLGQGAGIAAATGVLLDGGSGADRYAAASRSQGYGAGETFVEDLWVPGGTGVLVDAAGRNTFTGPGKTSALWFQGQDGVGVGLDVGRLGGVALDTVDTAFWLFGMTRPQALIEVTIDDPGPGTELHGDLFVHGTAGAEDPLEVEYVEWRVDFSPWAVADPESSWTTWSAALDVDAVSDGYHEMWARAWAQGVPSGPSLVPVQVERWLPTWDVDQQGSDVDIVFDLHTRNGDPVDSEGVVLRALDQDGGELAVFSECLSQGGGRYRASWVPPEPGSFVLSAEIEGQVLGETTWRWP